MAPHQFSPLQPNQLLQRHEAELRVGCKVMPGEWGEPYLHGSLHNIPDGHEHDVLHLQQPFLHSAAGLRRGDRYAHFHLSQFIRWLQNEMMINNDDDDDDRFLECLCLKESIKHFTRNKMKPVLSSSQSCLAVCPVVSSLWQSIPASGWSYLAASPV